MYENESYVWDNKLYVRSGQLYMIHESTQDLVYIYWVQKVITHVYEKSPVHSTWVIVNYV